MPRIYRTEDGRHVPDGHQDAAFLAYAEGDEVPADVLAEVEGKPKRGRKPADKQATKPADKASGVTVTRLKDKTED